MQILFVDGMTIDTSNAHVVYLAASGKKVKAKAIFKIFLQKI